MRTGRPSPLGATPDADGVNFAIWSSVADAVELCFFDADGRQTMSCRLPGLDNHIWHGYIPGCKPGQRYGYRVHGEWDPASGKRCNPAKLLLDPYARAICGEFVWHPAVFDGTKTEHESRINKDDSAPYVPKSVVFDSPPALRGAPRIPWAETIFYEANVRGYTMQHPGVEEKLRGTFKGLTNKAVLAHLRSLGITSLELMPVQAFIDEHHLSKLGLRNFWGYNTISFFAPMPRLASAGSGRSPHTAHSAHSAHAVLEFREMVNAIHDAGIEVVLDVAFNHTGESGTDGPTLAFRGIDNLAYYRTLPGDPARYINDTATGNTLNADHPVAQNLVLDCLRYWASEMGVDGFRFDLAPILGRHSDGFTGEHPLIARISNDPVLARIKLIAEPWDAGPGGYQLGNFPARWAEWNDRFRDGARRFWRGDPGQNGEFAKRLHGSADLFETAGKAPASSINFVTAHDGFTLTDVVSFANRHNEANGEDNRDGHAHNYSNNHGAEGLTANTAINLARRQHRLNLLSTLFLSQGSPLLLAGDEFGNSQQGNNNAYAQDNPIGWIDWRGMENDSDFTDCVRTLIRLRLENPVLRMDAYLHDTLDTDAGRVTLEWLRSDGEPMTENDWSAGRPMLVVFKLAQEESKIVQLAIAVNGTKENADFQLPVPVDQAWRLEFSSARDADQLAHNRIASAAQSISVLRLDAQTI